MNWKRVEAIAGAFCIVGALVLWFRPPTAASVLLTLGAFFLASAWSEEP